MNKLKKFALAVVSACCVLFSACGLQAPSDNAYALPQSPATSVITTKNIEKPNAIKLYADGNVRSLDEAQLDALWTELDPFFNLPNAEDIAYAEDVLSPSDLIGYKKNRLCLELLYNDWQATEGSKGYYGVLVRFDNGVLYTLYRFDEKTEYAYSTRYVTADGFEGFAEKYPALMATLATLS